MRTWEERLTEAGLSLRRLAEDDIRSQRQGWREAFGIRVRPGQCDWDVFLQDNGAFELFEKAAAVEKYNRKCAAQPVGFTLVLDEKCCNPEMLGFECRGSGPDYAWLESAHRDLADHYDLYVTDCDLRWSLVLTHQQYSDWELGPYLGIARDEPTDR